ncbi:MAG: hypothetical protein PVH26_07050 [Desulfosarcina sp.]|jgi:hypothetical protein
MAAEKKESVIDFLKNTFNECDIDYRENSITLSYDFVIDTGTARIFLKIGQKRWDDSDGTSILDFLKSKEKQIRQAVVENQNAIIRMN